MKHLILFLFINFIYAQENSIFWEAKNKNTTIYLLGTVHLKPIDSLKNKNLIIDKLLKSNSLFIEVDNRNWKNLDNFFLNRKNNNLQKKLEKYYSIFDSLFTEKKYFNYYTERELNWKLQKKWLELTNLNYQNIDLISIEESLIDLIKQKNKTIIELDNLSFVFEAINQSVLPKLSDSKINKVNKLILQKIKNKELKKEYSPLKNYNKGIYSYNFSKNLDNSDKILVQRNKDWLIKINNYILNNINDKNLFIMVGIEHLNFQQGLLEQLKIKGYEINPINL